VLTRILRILNQRMGRLMVLLALVVPMFASATPAHADDKSVGVGLEFGQGPGLSLKIATSATGALQFGAHAFDYGLYRARSKESRYYYGYEYGYAGFFVHGEYLSQQGTLIKGRSVSLPWYIGGGGDLGLGSGAAAFALHGNLGLALKFHTVPIDIFLEWTPRIWLVDFVQLRALDINGGIRFWF